MRPLLYVVLVVGLAVATGCNDRSRVSAADRQLAIDNFVVGDWYGRFEYTDEAVESIEKLQRLENPGQTHWPVRPKIKAPQFMLRFLKDGKCVALTAESGETGSESGKWTLSDDTKRVTLKVPRNFASAIYDVYGTSLAENDRESGMLTVTLEYDEQKQILRQVVDGTQPAKLAIMHAGTPSATMSFGMFGIPNSRVALEERTTVEDYCGDWGASYSFTDRDWQHWVKSEGEEAAARRRSEWESQTLQIELRNDMTATVTTFETVTDGTWSKREGRQAAWFEPIESRSRMTSSPMSYPTLPRLRLQLLAGKKQIAIVDPLYDAIISRVISRSK